MSFRIQGNDSNAKPRDETFNIFINNADSYNGKYILSCLYKQGFDIMPPDHPKDVIENVIPDRSPKGKANSQKEDISLIPSTAAEDQKEGSLNFEQIINAVSQGPQESKYKIYGSLVNVENDKPDELFEVITENYEQFKAVIMKCDCVIYDISLDQSQIEKALATLSIIEQEIERHKGNAMKQYTPVWYILISTTMTWASTQNMSLIEQNAFPLSETDYHRRKPHPNYKEHYDCEREVLQKGRRFRPALRTYVICSGVTYGFEEHILSFFFERAWMNDDYLPVFGNGLNYIPMIHVADLAQIICNLLDIHELKNQYILAVEQTPAILRNIVKYISRTLGSGRIHYLNAEEAFLYSEIDQNVFDNMTVNVMMEPNFIEQRLGLKWKSEMNIVENIEEIVNEFKASRGLLPLKIFVHGPPCSGKTKLALLLSDHYNLQYISMKKILEMNGIKLPTSRTSSSSKEHKLSRPKSKSSLKERLLKAKQHDKSKDADGAEELFDVGEEDSEEESYQKRISEENKKLFPKDALEKPLTFRLPNSQVATLLRREMLMNSSQNQGFVLDGFPKTLKQAMELFKRDPQRHLSDLEEITVSADINDSKIIPSYLISLDASDEFLLDRISRAPEHLTQNTHYAERDMVRRLMFYRQHNGADSTLTDYFAECDTDIIEINVSEFPSENMDCILYICKHIIGSPKGFGLHNKEVEELATIDEYQKKLREEKEKLEQELQQREEKKAMDKKMEELMKINYIEHIKLQRILSPKIEKYRVFVATKILPFLSEALMVLAEKRPNDPVDFLSEYLFENNPQGKMYNPRYTRDGEMIVGENID